MKIVIVLLSCLALMPNLAIDAQPSFTQRPYSDSMRVLIVFVEFADDNSRGDPNVDFRGWPLFPNQETLPQFANSLVDGAAPFRDSTLTSYFHQQSNGQFKLLGDVYPRVLVTEHAEVAYHRPNGGYGTLTEEVLTRLDEDGTDFTRYDLNRNGTLDQLFIILRRDSERDNRIETYTGISCLDARCGGSITANRTRMAPIVVDGVSVDWDRSGSILYNRVAGNIIPQLWLVRLMAHEIGHDIWARFFNHIRALTDNDLPRHIGREKHGIGYVLMAGAGGARDTGGNLTISAFERLLLDWIDCPELTTSTSFLLRDLYASGDCRLINFEYQGASRTLILTNLQRVGHFDEIRTGGNVGQFQLGLLRTTGLLLHVTDGRRLDVIAADGDIQLSNYDQDYVGDLFGPYTGMQVSPWTDPPLTGYRSGLDSLHSWSAIESVRYEKDLSGELRIEYRDDFRVAPVIRRDSRIGFENGPVTINGGLRVAQRSMLTIGTDVEINGPVVVDAGATIIIDQGSSLTLNNGAPLRVLPFGSLILNGKLRVSGPVIVQPEATIKIESGFLEWLGER